MFKFPELKETTLRRDEYLRLFQSKDGQRQIIENANAKALARLELQERSRKKAK